MAVEFRRPPAHTDETPRPCERVYKTTPFRSVRQSCGGCQVRAHALPTSHSAWGHGMKGRRLTEDDAHFCASRQGIGRHDKQLLLTMKGVSSNTKAAHAAPLVERPAFFRRRPHNQYNRSGDKAQKGNIQVSRILCGSNKRRTMLRTRQGLCRRGREDDHPIPFR